MKYVQKGSPEEPEIPVGRNDGTPVPKEDKMVQEWVGALYVNDKSFAGQK